MKEKLKLIGQIVQIKEKGLLIEVKILDFKKSYGKDRYLITPVAGSGEIWIEKFNQ